MKRTTYSSKKANMNLEKRQHYMYTEGRRQPCRWWGKLRCGKQQKQYAGKRENTKEREKKTYYYYYYY